MANTQETRRTRVCIVSLYAYPLFNPECMSPFGGSEVRVALIAKELARRGKLGMNLVVFDHEQLHIEMWDRVTVYAWTGRRCGWGVLPPETSSGGIASAVTDPTRVERVKASVPRPIWQVARGFYRLYRLSHRLYYPLRRAASWLKRRLLGFGQIGFYIIARAGVAIYDEVDADIYVVHGNNEMAAELAYYCHKRGKKFVLLSGSDMDFDPTIKTKPNRINNYGVPGYLMLYAIEHADAYLVQTEHQCELLRQNFQRDSVVVRNPIDLEPIFPRDRQSNTILWVGKSDKVKRPEIVLDLARLFPEYSFTVILNLSNPEIRARCVEQANRLGNVTILHYVPFGEIERYFATVKLLVNTSLFEGFPNTFLQAAKYGVPIVSYKVDPGEILSRHGCGLWCDEDFERLKENVRQLMTMPSLYAETSARCLEYVRTYHDKDKIIAQYEDVLTGLR